MEAGGTSSSGGRRVGVVSCEMVCVNGAMEFVVDASEGEGRWSSIVMVDILCAQTSVVITLPSEKL
jgi:hypothetical protein